MRCNIYAIRAIWPQFNFFRNKKELVELQLSQQVKTPLVCVTPPPTNTNANNKPNNNKTKKTNESSLASLSTENRPLRIGIIGGGIAGITAAHSIHKYLSESSFFKNDTQQHRNYSISIYEASPNPDDTTTWEAATNKNANTMVPGVCHSVMITRATIYALLKDMVSLYTSKLIHKLDVDNNTTLNTTPPPPYFHLDLYNCTMNPNYYDIWFHFCKNLLHTFLLTSSNDGHQRSLVNSNLSKANRDIFLHNYNYNMTMKERLLLNVSFGFLALYRSKEKALDIFERIKSINEPAELVLDVKENNNPTFQSILSRFHNSNNGTTSDTNTISSIVQAAIYRPNDITASCFQYVKWLRQQCSQVNNIHFYHGVDIKKLSTSATSSTNNDKNNHRKFHIEFMTKDEDEEQQQQHHTFDLLILAAGIQTPILAKQLDVGKFCPIYPLRGFSMEVLVQTQNNNDSIEQDKRQVVPPLSKSFSVDNFYISSINPYKSIRATGFGEFVGFNPKVHSHAPKIMYEYMNALFHNNKQKQFTEQSDHYKYNVKEENIKWCFRPMSPDDLPLVGEVKDMPGLFLHTGHGTLGWTLSLATAECLAQCIAEPDGSTFLLSNGTIELERISLSPNRFL